LLVVSGPNAGGKTVVLKTAGLFCLLAQAGFPVPAAPGTRLPVFAVIRTEIGDAQEILSDKSTFSSSMETLASILEQARGGTLALIDEVGAATDPQEGSALSVAYLEAYLARGGAAIVTTHLSAVKDFAAGRPDALLAAMEYDEATGRPTYRLRPGLSGRSRALAVARERGVPGGVLDRAREILGAPWQRRDASEGAAEELLDRLRRQEKAHAALVEETARARTRLESERESFEKEKTRILRDGLERFERARRELSRRVDSALEEIRRRAPAMPAAPAQAADLLAEAEKEAGEDPLIAQAREQAARRSVSLAAGDSARLRGLQTVGRISSIEGDIAWLEVDGKRVRVGRSELEPAEGAPKADPAAARASVTRSAPAAPDQTAGEVNVIGHRLEEAIGEVDRALDQAILSGSARLRVIHGHGTGRLRTGLREHLRQHPAVERVRAGDAREGGNGATIVELA
jgi:DNA mismatch repair protein MutS2